MFLTLEQPFTAAVEVGRAAHLHAGPGGGDRRRPVQPRLHHVAAYPRHPTATDERHRIVATGIYQLPAGFRASAFIQLASGVGFTIEDFSRGFGDQREADPALYRPARRHLQLQERGPAPGQAVPLRRPPGLRAERPGVQPVQLGQLHGLPAVHPAAARGQRELRRARRARTPSGACSSACRIASDARRRLHWRRRSRGRWRPRSAAARARPRRPAPPRASRAAAGALRRHPGTDVPLLLGAGAIRGRAWCPTASPSRSAVQHRRGRLRAHRLPDRRRARLRHARRRRAERVLATLRFFDQAPQGPEPAGRTGHRGFFYHFLDMQTGHRVGRRTWSSPPSTPRCCWPACCSASPTSTAPRPTSAAIRELAERIYAPRGLELGRAAAAHRQHGMAARGRPLRRRSGASTTSR